MLDLNRCTIVESVPATLASTVLAIEEGLALVNVLEGGYGRVKPSNADSGEMFRGVALGNAGQSTNMKKYETFTVPASSPYTVTLARTPSADGVVVLNAAGANPRIVLAKAGTASATEYAISGNVLTFHSSFAGRTGYMVYPTPMLATEASQLQYGSANKFGGMDLSIIPAIGLITTGEVFIDNYDPTSDWASWTTATPVKLAANGVFTLGGSGASVTSIAVTKVPSAGDPWLGLYLNAA